MIESSIKWLFSIVALPEVGLTSVFLISLVSATLLPMGSEPAVFGVIKAGSSFWTVIVVATIGNTLGGLINYWLGYGAKQAFAKERESRWFGWLQRFGAKTMLLTWLPVIGDPLCTLAGWLKLSFWPCVAYMAIGKFLRYVIMTSFLLYVPDTFWERMGQWLSW